ncbi:MAG: hypothetical protein WBV75_13330, partial [Robiginitalea sp.]
PEYWRGIHLESISSNNRLENVTIANAGNTYVYCCNPKASLFINQGLISLKNVTIEKGGAYGLYAKEGSGFSDFQNVQIRSHKGYPLVIESAALGSLGTGNDFSGNDQDYIYILPEALTYSLLWPRQEIPYYIPEILDITADLTLEAGTTFFFGDKAGLGIYGQGSLSAIGTSSDPIEFKGILNSRGSWRGIHIETKNPKNRLEYVKIANAGSDFVYCCNEKASLFLKGANIGLSNLTLSKGGGTGIYIGEESLLSTYRDIKITSHDGSPLLMDAETVRFLDSNSDYSGNTDSFIHIFGDVKKNTTWSLQNIPYRIEQGVMDVTSSLIIEAGVIVEMGQNSGIGVYDQGSITADGKLESPIVFKGLNDIPGYWRGFHIETNSTANLFSHVELKNAGSNYVYCCNEKAGIILKGSGRLAMQHTNIHRNNGCGIFAHSQAQLRMGEGNTLSDNSSGNVCR